MDYRRFCVLYRSYRKYRSSSRTDVSYYFDIAWVEENLLKIKLLACIKMTDNYWSQVVQKMHNAFKFQDSFGI